MKIKFMTLNLWAYFDWGNRKDNLISVLKDESPDVVTLQEVQINTYFSNVSQVEDLAGQLGYTYYAYSPVWGRTDYMHYDEHKDTRLSHGLGFMSKYPIVSIESYFLKQQPDHDEPYNVQFVMLDINGSNQLVCNVHFGNSDTWSDLHLKELMQLCHDRNIQPILLGDFNNFNLEKYKAELLKDHTISTEIEEYESMPKNQGTLDYIVVPKNSELSNINCIQDYISDHRAVTATIEM